MGLAQSTEAGDGTEYDAYFTGISPSSEFGIGGGDTGDTDVFMSEEVANKRLRQLLDVQREARNLFENKNRNYDQVLSDFGVIEVLLHVGNEIKQNITIRKSGITMANNNSLRKSLIDLMNYTATSIMYLEEEDDDVVQPDTYFRHFAAVQKEAKDLFEKKNHDYGDAFANYGVIGVLIRMGDKIQRIASICKSGVTLVNSESLHDTLIDLMNYSTMAVMLIDEEDDHGSVEEAQ